MNDFKSIDELLRVLEREKLLLKQMFQKRPSTSLKYDYTLELTEYKEERIKYLIDYGIIRDSGNFLEWRMYILNSSRRFYKSMRT